VHGVDPATGAPALLAAGLTGRAARRLAARLRTDGWVADAERDAWGWFDLGWLAVGVLVGGLLLSLPGAAAGLLGMWSWRLAVVRADLAGALPPVSIPLPPAVAPPGAEEAVTAGLLLLLAALILPFSPWIAAGMVLAVCGLATWTLRRRIASPGDDLSRARLETLLADARRLLEARPLPLDRALGLEGEVWELERAWRVGEVPVDLAIARAEVLRRRAERGDPSP
jgi:hypothetical protein